MFFRRNEGEFRETDRVTRFKLIKSGKNWLRAATSNFGLFKVVKGGADTPSVTVQNVEEKSSLLSGTALLKGIAAAGAVAGGAVATYTAQAEETSAPALESQATTHHDIIANSDSVALSAAPVSETVLQKLQHQLVKSLQALQLTLKQAQTLQFQYHNLYQQNCHKLSQNLFHLAK